MNSDILCFVLALTKCYVASPTGYVGVIGGHNITIEKAPYMVSLRLNGTYHWCGGSIIHQHFILTAAHCIVPNREYKVLVGTVNDEIGGELYDIEKIIIHNKFSYTTNEYDACLLKLFEDLKYSDKVSKIKLVDNQVKLKQGTLLNVTGWGSTFVKGPISKELLQVSVPFVKLISCKISYLKIMHPITNKMICAGDNGRDSCQGDSGGPLTYKDEQVGIASFGYGCGNRIPGVYTKVSAIESWIHETISNESH